MSKDLDELLKEAPTLTFEPFSESKEEVADVDVEAVAAEQE